MSASCRRSCIRAFLYFLQLVALLIQILAGSFRHLCTDQTAILIAVRNPLTRWQLYCRQLLITINLWLSSNFSGSDDLSEFVGIP